MDSKMFMRINAIFQNNAKLKFVNITFATDLHVNHDDNNNINYRVSDAFGKKLCSLEKHNNSPIIIINGKSAYTTRIKIINDAIIMVLSRPTNVFRHTHIHSEICHTDYYDSCAKKVSLINIIVDGNYDEFGVNVLCFDIGECCCIIGICLQLLTTWSCRHNLFGRSMYNRDTKSLYIFISRIERLMLEQYARYKKSVNSKIAGCHCDFMVDRNDLLYLQFIS